MNEPRTAGAAGSPHFQTVVLPSDGSPSSLAALPTGRALRERFDARLVIVAVATDADDAHTLQHSAQDALGDTIDNESVEVIIGDDPAKVIVALTEELGPSVVCMSTRGRGRIAGSLFGSVARSVIQLSTSPIVVVGPQADRPGWLVGRPRRRPASWPAPLSRGGILACVDGSSDSEAVLPEAARWASALDKPLSIVTVAEDAAADWNGHRPNRFGPENPQQYVDELAAYWRDTRRNTIGTVVYDPIGVASGLKSYLASQPVALVALSSHARTGLDRLRFGATSAEIVAASTAPVLVVPVTGR